LLAYQRRAWSLLLYVATAAAGCAVITHYGSPWVDAKALATASPLVLVAAAAAIGALLERAHWAVPLTLAALIGGGVIWSNALAYGGTSLAPRGQLHELQQIGNRIAGQGPTLMTEYQPYGARHFLRRADAEAASELRVRPDVLTRGTTLPKGAFADADEFLLTSLLDYKTLVLRRSPAGSRPPSSFKLVSQGRWYDVWQRDPQAPVVLRHIGLGNPVQPTGIASCSDVMGLAKEAGPQGRLATVFRSPVVVVDLNTFTHPPAWTDPAGADLLPGSKGSATGQVYIANPGAYELWIGGSVRSRLEARVDGSTVGSMRDQLNVSGQWSDYGPVTIGPGSHAIELRASGPDLSPGSAALAPPLGPLALTLASAAPAASYLATSNARSLCGKNLDWLEAVN